MKGMSIFGGDRRFMKSLGTASKISEYLHPQLLGTNVITNPGTVFKILFSIAKLFIGKKTLEKLKVCSSDTLKGDITKCPFSMKHLIKDDIPSFLGGDCHCTDKGGCINGVHNGVSKKEK